MSLVTGSRDACAAAGIVSDLQFDNSPRWLVQMRNREGSMTLDVIGMGQLLMRCFVERG